ncbi:hypothetical protein B0H17DRAFT_333056 [Mycena rosella]|uniref:Uncharacterized protein n=1 Tax=Mycena rosella TaxID=1033263 RepID=A0AAD7GK13_MYCRO|nr:hypothetical protein B0H17DRAFT_333056 [Mycena rosella]
MSAVSVLQIQELCDYIVDFLHDSSPDLKSCALVSTPLASSAQRHLFYDIILNQGTPSVDDSRTLWNFDEAGACTRLCSALRASPHLIGLIRRLRASLEEDILDQLRAVPFGNLQDFVLSRRGGAFPEPGALLAATEIIGLPSIRRVRLIRPTLPDIHHLSRLFQQSAPQLHTLSLNYPSLPFDSGTLDPSLNGPAAKIKSLHITAHRFHWKTLLHSLGPFDFTELQDIDCGGMTVHSCSTLLSRSQSTINKLALHLLPRNADPEPAGLRTLLSLPSLTHLVVKFADRPMDDLKALFAPLLLSNELQDLALEFYTEYDSLRASYLDGLRLILSTTAFPVLRHMKVALNLTSSINPPTSETEGHLRAALTAWDARGQLEIVVSSWGARSQVS